MLLLNYSPSNFKKISCIYAITNKVNGKLYIGRTINFQFRHWQYVRAFKAGTHVINDYLKNSMIKHGINNFDISIVEICAIENLKEKEDFYIEYFKSHLPKRGYNLRRDIDGNMDTHPLTRIKISNNLKDQWNKGIRKEHGKKLKKSWENDSNRKKNQSVLFSKTLTKYEYHITKDNITEIVNYQRLKELKLQNCIATMFKSKKESIVFKGYIIDRIKLS